MADYTIYPETKNIRKDDHSCEVPQAPGYTENQPHEAPLSSPSPVQMVQLSACPLSQRMTPSKIILSILYRFLDVQHVGVYLTSSILGRAHRKQPLAN